MSASSANSVEVIANDVIQSEMHSLRMALAELTVATSCSFGPPPSPPPDSADASDRRSERIFELEAQVARLTLENEQLDAANRSLRSESNRLSELLHQHDEGGAAETEILRRRLSSVESRLEGLQAALAAALHQYEGRTRRFIDEEWHSRLSPVLLAQSVEPCCPRSSEKWATFELKLSSGHHHQLTRGMKASGRARVKLAFPRQSHLPDRAPLTSWALHHSDGTSR